MRPRLAGHCARHPGLGEHATRVCVLATLPTPPPPGPDCHDHLQRRIRRETYRRRNTIERCFNRLKGFRGIATRYEKTATSYEAAVTLASFLLWARSV
nr:transposase [Streptomyces longwoodensis]